MMRPLIPALCVLNVLSAPALAQDYSAGSGRQSGTSGNWDYSTGSHPSAPVESYENYPPPPVQVLVGPGGYGGGYSSGQTGSSSGIGNTPPVPVTGTGQGNTGWGALGAGNTGFGNIGDGNTGWGQTGAGGPYGRGYHR